MSSRAQVIRLAHRPVHMGLHGVNSIAEPLPRQSLVVRDDRGYARLRHRASSPGVVSPRPIRRARPAGRHRLRASLDSEGRPIAWLHRLVSTSRYEFRGDPEGPAASEMYADDFPAGCVPNVRFEYSSVPTSIPTGAWRATLHSANAFAVQSFVDELAHAAGRDPVELRLAMLGEPRELPYSDHGGPVFDTGRMAGVIRFAAERCDWGSPPGEGRGRGIAAHFTCGTYAAEVAEVTVSANGDLRVDRIVAVLDCGIVVNRSSAEA